MQKVTQSSHTRGMVPRKHANALLKKTKEQLSAEKGAAEFATKLQLLLWECGGKPASLVMPLPVGNAFVAFTSTHASVEELLAFFDSPEGIHVTPDFRRFVLSKMKQSHKLQDSYGTSRDLKKRSRDADIIASLPPDYVFGEYEMCVRIREMILRQRDGRKGDLLTNGGVNLFYSLEHVAVLSWEGGDYARWNITARKVDTALWPNQGRAFSRT